MGTRAWRAQGRLAIVNVEGRFDLRIEHATLTPFGGCGQGRTLVMSNGLGGEVVLDGCSFAARAGCETVLEFPEVTWFGLDVALFQNQIESGPCLLQNDSMSFGITTQRRYLRPLNSARWVVGATPRRIVTPSVQPPEVVHASELPKRHSAVPIAPELYAVLRDEEEGSLRFEFERDEYGRAARTWISEKIAVLDEGIVGCESPALRQLNGPQLVASSLLLLPWLACALERRSRCTPIVQLLAGRLCWIDSAEESWRQILKVELARIAGTETGQPLGQPLVFRDGAWTTFD